VGITASGTVGAALQAATLGLPALAVSLETDVTHHLTYSNEVDFSTAAYFTLYFARLLLKRRMPPDVRVLKVDVPRNATPETPWEVTRLSHLEYFESLPPPPRPWGEPGRLRYRVTERFAQDRPDTDAYGLRVRGVVTVTPLSLDLTARVDLAALGEMLQGDGEER